MTVDVFRGHRILKAFVVAAFLFCFMGNPVSQAAITWDAGGNSQWWFDPNNWSNNFLPPNNGTGGVTDAQINLGTGAWDLGEGVVYDPANDPFFAAAAGATFPAPFGPQIINHLYMSRNTTATNKLTIKGDLQFNERVHVGRSSGVRGQATNATVIQESGFVNITLRELDLAQVDTSNVGLANGNYIYKSGTLEVSQQGGSGMRLSSGSNSLTSDGLKAGPSGIGKFVIHNPATTGHIRVWALVTAAFAGFDEGVTGDPLDSVFDPQFDANGETTGVGIFEFRYANGGTRPVQVNTDMTLHNGLENNTKGIRSSRLDLQLDAAACAGAACVPNNIGLFDVAFGGSGALLGSGDLNGNGIFSDDRVFSSIDNTVDYYEGTTVSAIFGSTKYNWTISYTGAINWTDPDAGTIGSVTGSGTGNDIVLVGLSSESVGIPGDFDDDDDVDGRDFLIWQRGGSTNGPLNAGDLSDWQTNFGAGDPLASVTAVPEPGSLALVAVAMLPLFGRRRG